MEKDERVLENIKNELKKFKREGYIDNSLDEDSGIYMFFSFDLVNSTGFKHSHEEKWKTVISAFYKIVSEKFLGNNGIIGGEFSSKRWGYVEGYPPKAMQEPFKLWKYIGDEVLLYKKIVCEEEIEINIEWVYREKRDILERLIQCRCEFAQKKNCSMCATCDYKLAVECKSYAEAIRNTLGLKTCIWIAECGSRKGDHKNIAYRGEERYELNMLDFLGPDIDEGFRISKYAEKDKVLISAKLACVLWKLSEKDINRRSSIESRFRIACYKKLKGIWNGRAYPLIVYSNNFDLFFKELEYDEFMDSELVKGLLSPQMKFQDIDMGSPSTLEKIYNNLNEWYEIATLIKHLKRQIAYYAQVETPIRDKRKRKDNAVQINLICICYNQNKEVVIFRRALSRPTYPGLWGFGSFKLDGQKDLRKCIRESYRIAYNIYLEEEGIRVIDTFFEENESTYTFGIIAIGKIISECQTIELLNKDRYDAFQIKSIIELEDLKLQTVPKFKDYVKLLNERLGR